MACKGGGSLVGGKPLVFDRWSSLHSWKNTFAQPCTTSYVQATALSKLQ